MLQIDLFIKLYSNYKPFGLSIFTALFLTLLHLDEEGTIFFFFGDSSVVEMTHIVRTIWNRVLWILLEGKIQWRHDDDGSDENDDEEDDNIGSHVANSGIQKHIDCDVIRKIDQLMVRNTAK